MNVRFGSTAEVQPRSRQRLLLGEKRKSISGSSETNPLSNPSVDPSRIAPTLGPTLVDLAALDGGGHTEGVADRFAERLRAIDDEQPGHRRISAVAGLRSNRNP